MTPDPLEECAARLEKIAADIRRLRLVRRLYEYPDGHPEEPTELRKFREQNPNWRDYQD